MRQIIATSIDNDMSWSYGSGFIWAILGWFLLFLLVAVLIGFMVRAVWSADRSVEQPPSRSRSDPGMSRRDLLTGHLDESRPDADEDPEATRTVAGSGDNPT